MLLDHNVISFTSNNRAFTYHSGFEEFFKFENTVAHSLPLVHHVDSRETDAPLLPEISPSNAPQPFIPLLAPAPLAPFFNNSTPKLSGWGHTPRENNLVVWH